MSHQIELELLIPLMDLELVNSEVEVSEYNPSVSYEIAEYEVEFSLPSA